MKTDTQTTTALMEKTIRILLIDDDMKFCRLITEYLSDFGFEVTSAHNGACGLTRALEGEWQAVILDVMLPVLDGFKVLQKLREKTSVPILMLTGLGEETERVTGLELGADDYLPKTSSARELLARLKAVLRRTAAASTTNATPTIPDLKFGSLSINLEGYSAKYDDTHLPLTPVEFDLLVVLAKACGRIKTREDLITEIRDRNYELCDRSIDVHISALRRKLKDDARKPKFIKTVRNGGYMMIV